MTVSEENSEESHGWITAFRASMCVWMAQGPCRLHIGRSGVESETPPISKMTVVADLCPWSTPGEEKSFPVPPGKFGTLNRGHRNGKGQFSFQYQRRAMPKNVQTTTQLQSFHMLAKSCSKSSKLGFNSMWTEHFQIYKMDLEKAEESEIKLPSYVGSLKKQESSRKTSISALLTMPKPLSVWMTINWKILRDGNTRPPDLPLEKPVCRSGSNS